MAKQIKRTRRGLGLILFLLPELLFPRFVAAPIVMACCFGGLQLVCGSLKPAGASLEHPRQASGFLSDCD